MAGKVHEIAFKIAGKMAGSFSKAFSDAQKAVNGTGKSINALNQEAAKVDKLIKNKKAVGEAAREYYKARQNVENLSREMSQTANPSQRMQQEFEKAKAAATRAKTALDKQRASLDKLQKESGETARSLQQLTKRQKELEAQAKKTVAVQEKLAEINEKIQKNNDVKDKASKAAGFGNGALAAGGAAAGALAKMGGDYQAAMARMQAQTGATAAELQKIGQAAQEIYSAGLGESFEHVAQSMANVRQVTGLTGNELKEATKNALLLAKAFDFDVNETARSSAALMKNFGIEGQKAHDLIAYAAQNGANKNGDLLDTFNEYSVHYKALGFSAEQFAAHLVKGAQDGSFSIDKVGDAIKEFNIRAKDGSKSSAEGFTELGFEAEHATKIFAAGGEQANKAFFEVVNRLNEIDDPVKRNTIGVKLFGTQFEDLEAGALKSMASLKDATLDTAGVMGKIDKAMGGDLNTQLAKVARSFQVALIPVAQKFSNYLIANMPKINATMQSFADKLQFIGNNWAWIGPIVKSVLVTLLAYKAVAGITVVVMSVYNAFLMIKSAVIAYRATMAGLTVATNANTAALVGQKAALIAQKAMLLATKAPLIAAKVVTWAATAAQWAFNAALWANPITWVVAGIVAAVALLGFIVYKYWNQIVAATLWLWAKIKQYGAMIGKVVLFIANPVAGLAYLVYKHWDSIKAKTAELWGSVKNFGGRIASFFTTTIPNAAIALRDKIAGAFSALVGLIKTPINAMISLVNKAISGINGLSVKVPDWVPGVGGANIGFNIPRIPQLAEGGIATRPTLATIGEGRENEAVLPLSKLDNMLAGGGGMGGGISVNFAPVINITGGGSDAYSQVKAGLNSGVTNLKAELEKLMNDKRRLSYI